jgi:hypothetical protein
MTGVQKYLKRTLNAAVLAASLGLTGCAGDGVELNGKIFDWMGVSESAQAANKREPKLADRTGLIVPPNLARLPEPGSEQPQDANFNLNDPDQKRIAAAADREREHKAYCSGEKNWKERALDKNAAAARSPHGPCNQFVGDALQNSTGPQAKR